MALDVVYEQWLAWRSLARPKGALYIERPLGVDDDWVEVWGREAYRQVFLVDGARLTHQERTLLRRHPFNPTTFLCRLGKRSGVDWTPADTLLIIKSVDELDVDVATQQALIRAGLDTVLTGAQAIDSQGELSRLIEQTIRVSPLPFQAFDEALGNITGVDLQTAYRTLTPLKGALAHVTRRFQTYMVLGGLPSVVAAYKETRDWRDVEREKRQAFLALSSALHRRYARGQAPSSMNTVSILHALPTALLATTPRFRWQWLAPHRRARNTEASLTALVESGWVGVAHPYPRHEETPSRPSAPVLSFFDTGLLSTLLAPTAPALGNPVYVGLLTSLSSPYQRGWLLNTLHAHLRRQRARFFTAYDSGFDLLWETPEGLTPIVVDVKGTVRPETLLRRLSRLPIPHTEPLVFYPGDVTVVSGIRYLPFAMMTVI